MRALPRPSRITILAVCLAVAAAVILAIGCMRGLDAPARHPDQPEGALAPVAPARQAGQAAVPESASRIPAGDPGAASVPAAGTDRPPVLDPSPFSHMVEPLAARLFFLSAGALPEQSRAEPEPAMDTASRPAAEAAPAVLAALPEKTAPPQAMPKPGDAAAPPKVEHAAPGLEPTAAASAKAPGRTVLVVGDSFAVGIGMTMAESLRGAKEIRLEQKGKTSSGLDNVKFHNWEKTLEGLLASTRPNALVVMIGGNDAQNGPGTETWAASYRRKSEDFLGIAAKRNVPVYWVSLPPMRDDGLNTRVKTTNAAMRAACESSPNCRFIDAWDLFSDDKGSFAAEKTLGGKNVKLRGKDGVHFTMAGYRLLSDRILDGFAPDLQTSQKN